MAEEGIWQHFHRKALAIAQHEAVYLHEITNGFKANRSSMTGPGAATLGGLTLRLISLRRTQHTSPK